MKNLLGIHDKQRGFSLLELLLSLSLGFFILSGIYLLFFSSQQVYISQEAVTQSQEIGRIGINLIRDQLRETRGVGCRSWDSNFSVFIQAKTLPEWFPLQAHQLVRVYYGNDYDWTPPLPSYLNGRVKSNTDVMVIHQSYQESSRLQQNMANPQMPLLLTGALHLSIGDFMIISDCEQADIFQISHLQKQGNDWLVSHQPPLNTSSALSKAYHDEAEASLFKIIAYYVGDTKRTSKNKMPIYALHMFDEEHQELLEGISDFTVISHPNKNEISFVLETEMPFFTQSWNTTVNIRN